MLDPAAFEMMQALSRPLPMLIAFDGDAAQADALSPARLRRYRALQGEMTTVVSNWIAAAENLVAALEASLAANALLPQDLAALRATIHEIEASFDEDARRFRRIQADTKAQAAAARARPSAEADEMAEVMLTYLSAFARYGQMKTDLFFALGSIEAQARPDSGKGPVFSDPDELVAYLRGAIA